MTIGLLDLPTELLETILDYACNDLPKRRRLNFPYRLVNSMLLLRTHPLNRAEEY